MDRSKPHCGLQKPLLTGKPERAGSQVAPPSTDLWIVPARGARPSPVAAKTVTTAPTLLTASLLSTSTPVASVRANTGDTLPPTDAVPALIVRQIPWLAATSDAM